MEKVIEYSLSPEEQEALQQSADHVRETIEALKY